MSKFDSLNFNRLSYNFLYIEFKENRYCMYQTAKDKEFLLKSKKALDKLNSKIAEVSKKASKLSSHYR